MEKRIVVIKRPGSTGSEPIEQFLRKEGYSLEMFELAKHEPLPKSLHEFSGLLILGGPMSVLEQQTNPFMKVYLGP